MDLLILPSLEVEVEEAVEHHQSKELGQMVAMIQVLHQSS